MAVALEGATAFGRAISAGRMLAGMDQAALGSAAGVAASTISNVERGNDARSDTTRAIKRALREAGVLVTYSTRLGMAQASLIFEEPDEDEE